MNILIKNCPSLIGDFLGIIPALQELSRQGNDIYIDSTPETDTIIDILTSKYKISRSIPDSYDKEIIINIGEVFGKSCSKGWYMSQGFWDACGLEVTNIVPKIKIKQGLVSTAGGSSLFEYILISPFARSLPEEQKLKKEVWQDLIDSNPHIHFYILGNSKFDDKNYLEKRENCSNRFDSSFRDLVNLFKHSHSLISVVTGTSHLAFHLGVKNILLTNQNMTWGNQPDAIQITDWIPNIQAETIVKQIQNESN